MRARAVVAGVFAAAIACAGASPPDPTPTPATPDAELGQPFTLAPGESASLDAGKITVRFVSVPEDSRCPKNEQCVWAGNARVELEVRVGSGEPRTIALNTNKAEPVADLGGYSVTLRAVAPEPVSGRALSPAEYRATLTVSRGAGSPPGEDQPIR